MGGFDIMGFFKGINYNLKGLRLGLKTPGLLMLGLLRFFVVILITGASVGLILYYHDQIFSLLWARPESAWFVWLWYIASWLLTILLVAVSAVLSYLVAQILFGVFIMDKMSRITERLVTGAEKQPDNAAIFAQVGYLLKQEIPRAVLPVMLALILMVLSWFTPLGPILTIVSPIVAAVFLAWDSTDLIPARQMAPFNTRLKLLLKNPLFHLGFGILFLIPLVNILILSFSPVGGTMFFIDKEKERALEKQDS